MCIHLLWASFVAFALSLLPVAVVALERFGTSVFAVVPRQFVASCETPFTAFPGAFVRLLTCMHKHTSFNPCFTIHTHTCTQMVHLWSEAAAVPLWAPSAVPLSTSFITVSLNHTFKPANQIARFLSRSANHISVDQISCILSRQNMKNAVFSGNIWRRSFSDTEIDSIKGHFPSFLKLKKSCLNVLSHHNRTNS